DVEPVEDTAYVRIGGDRVDPVERDDADVIVARREAVDRVFAQSVPNRQLTRDRADGIERVRRRTWTGRDQRLHVRAEDRRAVKPAHDGPADRSGRSPEIHRAGRKSTRRGLRVDGRISGPVIQLERALPRVPDDEGDHRGVRHARVIETEVVTVLVRDYRLEIHARLAGRCRREVRRRGGGEE